MKFDSFVKIAIYASLILSCSACHKQEEQLALPLQIELDERQWTPLQKNVTAAAGRDFTLEFVPPGQNANNWTELLTVQFFAFNHPEKLGLQPVKDKQITAIDFESTFLKTLKDGIADKQSSVATQKRSLFTTGTVIKSQDLAQSTDSTMFKWQADSPDGTHSQEIVRVVQGERGLNVLHYATKAPLTGEQLAKWQKLLSQAHLESLIKGR